MAGFQLCLKFRVIHNTFCQMLNWRDHWSHDGAFHILPMQREKLRWVFFLWLFQWLVDVPAPPCATKKHLTSKSSRWATLWSVSPVQWLSMKTRVCHNTPKTLVPWFNFQKLVHIHWHASVWQVPLTNSTLERSLRAKRASGAASPNDWRDELKQRWRPNPT